LIIVEVSGPVKSDDEKLKLGGLGRGTVAPRRCAPDTDKRI
jgi:hypothetical protein